MADEIPPIIVTIKQVLEGHGFDDAKARAREMSASVDVDSERVQRSMDDVGSSSDRMAREVGLGTGRAQDAFGRTGDEASRMRDDVSRGADDAARHVASFGGGVGHMGGVVTSTLGGIGPSIMGLSAKWLSVTAAVGSVVGALPGLTASLAPLLGLGLGVGVLAMGFKLVASSSKLAGEEMKAAGQTIDQTIMGSVVPTLMGPFHRVLSELPKLAGEIAPALTSMFSGAATMIQPLIHGLVALSREIMPQLGETFRATAPLIGSLLHGIGGFLSGIISGVNTILHAIGPAMGMLGETFRALGKDIGELFSAGAPAIKAVAEVFNVLMQALGAILPAIMHIGVAFATALAPAFKAFAGAIEAMLPALEPLFAILGQLAAAVLGDLGSALGALATLLRDLAPSFTVLAQAAGQVFTMLENTEIFAILGDALEQLAPQLANLVNVFVTGLAPILPPVIQALAEVGKVIVEVLVAGVQALLPALTVLIQAALIPLVPVIQALAPAIRLVAELLGAGLVEVLHVLTPLITVLAPIVVGLVAALKAWAIIQGILNVVMDANPIGLVIVAVALLVGAVVELVRHFAEVREGIESAWHAITSAISGGVEAAVGFITSLPGRAINALAAFASDMFTIGRNAIVGLLNGLASVFQAVINTVGNFASGIISTLGSILQISSPSKVTEAMGRALGEGLIHGWLAGSAPLPKELSTRTNEAIEAARKVIEESRSRFTEAFSSLSSTAQTLFAAISGKGETKAGHELKGLEEGHEEASRQAALAKAKAEGSTEAIAEAEYAIRVAALKKQATAEEVELNAQNEVRKGALERALKQLELSLAKGHDTTAQAMRSIEAVLRSYGITFGAIGHDAGQAWVSAFHAQIEEVARRAGQVHTTITTQVRRVMAVHPVAVSEAEKKEAEAKEAGGKEGEKELEGHNAGTIPSSLPPVAPTVHAAAASVQHLHVTAVHLGEAWEHIWHGIESTIGSVVSFLVAHFGEVANVLLGIAAAPLIVAEHWQVIWGAISSFTLGIIHGVEAGLTAAWSAIKGAAEAAWNALRGVDEAIWGAIAAAISAAAHRALQATEETWHAMLSVAEAVWSAVKSAAVRLWEAIKEAISAAVHLARQIAEETWHVMLSTAEAVWNAIRNAAVTIWGTIVSFFTTVPGKIIGALGSLGGELLHLFTSALAGVEHAVTSGVGAVVGFFSGLPGKVLHELGSLPAELLHFGEHIIQEMAKGIASATGSVFNSIKGVVQGAIHELSTGFGIFSPSRVFADMGKSLMEGLAKGIEDHKIKPVGALKTAGEELISRMQGGIEGGGTGPVAEQIMRFWEAHGFNAMAAAGFVGNAAQESSLNPGEAGGGLYQQSGYPGSYGEGSVAAQSQHVLENLPASLVAALRNVKSASEAAALIMRQYEHPEGSGPGETAPSQLANANLPHREGAAEEAFRQYGGGSAKAASLSVTVNSNMDVTSQSQQFAQELYLLMRPYLQGAA